MKGNLIMTPQNQQAFLDSLERLDRSIREIRRVTHRLIPAVLAQYGLDAALKNHIAGINKSGILQVVYQARGIEAIEQMEQSKTLSIYRIIQELLLNASRHASATEVLVALMAENGKLAMTVEDNGRGFDPALTRGGGGMGWADIRARVDFLEGQLDIDSIPGSGTSVRIHINLAS